MRASGPGASADCNSSVTFARNERLDDGALTEAEKALIEQRFRDPEPNPHASGPCAEAKLRLMTPFATGKRQLRQRKGAKVPRRKDFGSWTASPAAQVIQARLSLPISLPFASLPLGVFASTGFLGFKR
jgi:hypothetical protein